MKLVEVSRENQIIPAIKQGKVNLEVKPEQVKGAIASLSNLSYIIFSSFRDSTPEIKPTQTKKNLL